jgi:uncharacterized protein YecT (DUF1311 family)
MPVISATQLLARAIILAATSVAALTLIPRDDAAAFNCQAASTRQEKAICADPAAKSADERMTEAFTALRSQMTSEADRDAVLTDQRHWITARNDSCSYDAQSKALAGPALSVCLARQSELRRLFLSGMPADGPGLSGSIRPFFRKGKGNNKGDNRVISGLRFASPQSAGELAFNRAVDAELKNVNVSDGSDGDTTDDFSMTLAYASPQLVSAHVVISYPSSAHPVDYHADINVDLAAGRMLTFDSVFRREAVETILAQCRPQLDDLIGEAAKSDLSDNDERAAILKDREKLVRSSVADMTRWSLGVKQMTLTIDDAQTRVSSACRLDTARLKPLMQAGFSLEQ